jgi:Na+(H+)/acetate symporter ActP
VVFGAVAVTLGILFKGQNVAFMVGLAFAVACSANFPPLLLSIVWRRFNTAGAVCSICRCASLRHADSAQPDRLGRPHALPAAIFPLRNPAIVSMPVSFVCGVIARFSLVSRMQKCGLTTRSSEPISALAPSRCQTGDWEGTKSRRWQRSGIVTPM